MEENKKGFIDWVKAHKKQLLIAGISVTTIIAFIIGIKDRDAIKELWMSLENSLSKAPEKLSESTSKVQIVPKRIEEVSANRVYTSPQKPFDVSQHIRNLSGGRQHSAEKAVEAAALGIDLLQHQTLVNTYTKCAA